MSEQEDRQAGVSDPGIVWGAAEAHNILKYRNYRFLITKYCKTCWKVEIIRAVRVRGRTFFLFSMSLLNSFSCEQKHWVELKSVLSQWCLTWPPICYAKPPCKRSTLSHSGLSHLWNTIQCLISSTLLIYNCVETCLRQEGFPCMFA